MISEGVSIKFFKMMIIQDTGQGGCRSLRADTFNRNPSVTEDEENLEHVTQGFSPALAEEYQP